MNRALVCRMIAVLLILSSTRTFAMQRADTPSLLISPSPAANAMGQSYGTLWASDPMAGVFNPAAVALFAQKNIGGSSFYLRNAQWPIVYGSKWPYSAWAVTVGRDVFKAYKFPLRLGVGYYGYYHRVNPNWPGPDYTDPFQFAERANGITLSMALDCAIKVGFGYTLKYFESQAGLFEAGSSFSSHAFAHDIGLIMQAPLFESFIKAKTTISKKLRISPFLIPSFHISQRNIGPKLKYKDASQRDPLPRQVYTGISLQTGLRYENNSIQFDLFHFHWAREVDDILVHWTADGRTHYLHFSPNINFWENVIKGKSNDRIAMHRGYEIGLADIVFLRRGRYGYSQGGDNLDTHGIGINFTQPLRLIASLLHYQRDKLWLDVLLDLDVVYHKSLWDAETNNPLDGTEFNGIIIKLRHVQF